MARSYVVLVFVLVFALACGDDRPSDAGMDSTVPNEAGVFPGCPDWAVGVELPLCLNSYTCPEPHADWAQCYEGTPSARCLGGLPQCPDGWTAACQLVDAEGNLVPGEYSPVGAATCEGVDEGGRLLCAAFSTSACYR